MNSEKIDLHYHQQLSALIDGELAPDQARFLLRRLQHDSELAACIDRWQLAGDVLRGNACAPAPDGFSSRVAAAVAAEAGLARAAASPARGRAMRWGGGALAASVAAAALLVVAPRMADDASEVPSPRIAGQAEVATPLRPVTAPAPSRPSPTVTRQAPVDAMVTARARPDALDRSGSTARSSADRGAAPVAQATQRGADAPLPVIHSIAIDAPGRLNGNPFSDVRMDPPSARPWPRAVLPRYSGDGFNAGYSGDRIGGTFYPFDPELPATPPLALPDPLPGEEP